MIKLKHQGFSCDTQGTDKVYTAVFQGTKAEMTALNNLPLGKVDITYDVIQINGFIRRTRMYQEAGSIWCCEISWALNRTGEPSSKPLAEYGVKSCQLEGGLLSVPLENHKNYRTNWKHYLACCEKDGTIPDWWESATENISPDKNYHWVSSLSELPVGPDEMGRVWKVLATPQMPGVTHYDVATYVIRESVKCASATAAGNYVSNKLNKISSPSTTFGISGSWKCDGAAVSWNGNDWVADLMYTCSGDILGWDSRLYD